jgi:hypothetical protein
MCFVLQIHSVVFRSGSTFVNSGWASLLYRKFFRIQIYIFFFSLELPHSLKFITPQQACLGMIWSWNQKLFWYPVVGGISLFWNVTPFLRDCTALQPTRCHSSRNVYLFRLISGNAVSWPIIPTLYIRNFPMHPRPFLPSCDLRCFVLPLQETPGVENWWKRSVV